MSKRAREAHVRRHARADKLSDPSDFAIRGSAKAARQTLAEESPHLSAKFPAGRVMVALLIVVTFTATTGAFDAASFGMVFVGLTAFFAILGCLRFLACLLPHHQSSLPHKADTTDIQPVWSILIALYDEADSVPSLLEGLSKLNWAPDKLDIIFACEQCDNATLSALKEAKNQYGFRIIRVPEGGPRTKPNALQTALPFAKGRFITVYDAEDRPHCDQLRAAFHKFANGPSNLAVVQAPLVTWNHSESWISKQFALDYAIWFRVILPALTRITGVLPLGGTSNHFRRDALLISGGWDPYNVTEDADLGIRLGRLGYCAGMIDQPTFEEAPPRIGAWIKQRGRWIQGHIQTVSVHLRTPVSLAKAMGWRGLMGFVIGLVIGPMSAVFTLPLSVSLIISMAINPSVALQPACLIGMAISVFGHVWACFVGAKRDGRWSLLTACFTLPCYFALQSLSACRAMWRVVFTPSVWDKTDHGCAARKRALPHL
jgi:glycosyltransferase XagB